MMNWKNLTHIALLSALALACAKDKGADSPDDADDGPMEDTGESIDESAAEAEESIDEAAEEVEDAVDEASDDLDGDPTTE